LGNLKGRNHLKEVGPARRILLKWILKNGELRK
jgi:hypothetical protein